MGSRKINIIAHRGASAIAPENTLKSFQKAIEAGADYVEFDVHFSKDHEIVVIHDGNLKRTTGIKGKVAEFTARQLSEMDAGEGEHIPTLAEVIQLCKNEIKIQIEIKVRGMAQPLFDALSRHQLLDQCLVSSFKLSELDALKNLDFRVPCASLDPAGVAWATAWVCNTGVVKHAKGHQFNGTHPFHRIVTKGFVRLAHAAGLFVNPWTVDDPRLFRKYIEWGVDGFITNKPALLAEILQQSNSRD